MPAPGGPQRTNSFPTAVALSPDGKYLAILNNGYGTAESKFQQSIALLDLASNQLRDFPDPRLALHAKQIVFPWLWLGAAMAANLYASMASLTDPEGKKPGDTGNGVAVYRLQNGALTGRAFSEAATGAARPRQSDLPTTPKSVAPGNANPVSRRTGGGEARQVAMRC